MARARLQVLGGFALVHADGRALSLPTRKSQALLARLSRRPGEEIARAHLAGLLWPDVPDDQGRTSLRQALAAVRRALGDAQEAVRAHDDGISVDAELLEVDVAELERALRTGAAAALDALLSRGAGVFLAGFPPVTDLFDDWVEAERASLNAKLLEAIRARLDEHVAAGALDAGLALSERALTLDAAFEPAYRARMRLLAARGDRAAALREWERCRDALQRALGIAPGGETEALRRELASTGRSSGERGAGAGAPRDGRPSLAVLPLDVLSTSATDELFARGLAEDIIFELSRFRTLRLVSGVTGEPRGSDAGAAGVPAADWLLCGTVRSGSGRVRLNLRLVDARTGRNAWTDRVEAELADLFSVQDRVTRAIAGALALHIDEAELDAARRSRPDSLEAYACWLRGMQLVRAGSRESDLEGRAFFSRALELDPTFARAWAGLSLSHFNDWSCTAWERWEENEREALRCAAEAIRLDDRDHVSHCILGRVLLYRHEWERAAEHMSRSLALNSSDPDTLAHLSIGYAYLGEAARAIELGRAAREINRFHPDWYLACLAMAHLVGREPREAAELLGRAPDAFVDSRAGLAAACAHAGEVEAGRDHARRFLERFRSSIVRRADASPAEALAWLFRINPLRRGEDRAWFEEGLVRAGLAPARAASISSAQARPASAGSRGPSTR